MAAPRQVPLGLINTVLVYFIQKLPLKSPARVTLESPERMFGYVAWGGRRAEGTEGMGLVLESGLRECTQGVRAQPSQASTLGPCSMCMSSTPRFT